MDFDPTSFPYSLNNVPDDVVERFLNFRDDTPQFNAPTDAQSDTQAPAPAIAQPAPEGATTTDRSSANRSSSLTISSRAALPMPVMQQAEPTSSFFPSSIGSTSPSAEDPSPSTTPSPQEPSTAMPHREPGWRSSWRAPVTSDADSSDSEEDLSSENVGNCVSSLIRMARHTDRPEREEAWEAAMPPLARSLLKLSFRPAADRDAVLAKASSLLSWDHDVSATEPLYGRSVLHWVCLLGDALIVDFTLRHGGTRCMNVPDLCGHVPLALLCKLRTIPSRRHTLPDASGIAATLIAHGASLDTLPHKGGELLFLPDLTISLASTLIGMGVPVDGGGAGAGMGTPLVNACWRGHWNLAAWLADSGADVKAKGRFRSGLLHHGAMPEALASRLVDKGCNPNARDMTGQTPLMCACESGNLPLARSLLQSGAWPEAADDGGRTVLSYAESAGPEFVQLIREALMLQPALKLASE